MLNCRVLSNGTDNAPKKTVNSIKNNKADLIWLWGKGKHKFTKPTKQIMDEIDEGEEF